MEGAKYAYIHDACGQTAFYLRRYPDKELPMQSSNAILLDGSKPESFTETLCGRCGANVGPLLSANIREL